MLILEWYHVLALFVMFCIFFFACAVAFTVYQSKLRVQQQKALIDASISQIAVTIGHIIMGMRKNLDPVNALEESEEKK